MILQNDVTVDCKSIKFTTKYSIFNLIYSVSFPSRDFVGGCKENNDSRLQEEINNSKLSQEIRIKLGASYDSRNPIIVSSSPSCTTSSIGYQYSLIPSLLSDNTEETPSDNSTFLQSTSMAAIESGGKNSNKKVGLHFC